MNAIITYNGLMTLESGSTYGGQSRMLEAPSNRREKNRVCFYSFSLVGVLSFFSITKGLSMGY